MEKTPDKKPPAAIMSIYLFSRFVNGPTYPDGPWRPKWGVQRGSVQFLSLCPGNPYNPLCGKKIAK